MKNIYVARILFSIAISVLLMGCGGGSELNQSKLHDNTSGEEGINIDSPRVQAKCDKNNPKVHFISSNEDWTMINSMDKTIFCVKPGDYSALGKIEIKKSGTSSQRRYILLDNGNNLHPAKLQRDQLAKYLLKFNNANYWTVNRQAYWEANKAYERNGLYSSSYNIFNRGYFIDTFTVFFIHAGSSENVIKNWHMEKTQWSVNKKLFVDTAAINLVCNNSGDFVKNTKIIDNEIINYVDAIQTVRLYGTFKKEANIDFSGTVIQDNLMYITSIMYSDGKGKSDINGEGSFSENAIDLKGGSLDPKNPIIIQNNIMFGYRKADSTNTKLLDVGAAVVSHYEVQNLIFKDNVIFNSNYAYISDGPLSGKIALYDTKLNNNLFYNIKNNVFDFRGKGIKGTYDSLRNVEIKENLFYKIGGRPLKIYNSEFVEIENNEMHAAKGKGMWFGDNILKLKSKGLVIKNNNFYNIYNIGVPDYVSNISNQVLFGNPNMNKWKSKRSYKIRKFTNKSELKTIF